MNFKWSADGLLDSIVIASGPTIVLTYDPAGRLVRRDSAGNVVSNFLWQGENLLAELGPSGTTRLGEYSYYLGLDRPHAWRGLSVPCDTTVLYAHQDGLGNVRGLSWGTVNSTERTYEFDEWGELTGGSGAATYDRARWKGALYMSPEADLYYMRARWYEPRTGRFLSEDPAGQGLNPYLFAAANPVSGSDPSGAAWIPDGCKSGGAATAITHCRSAGTTRRSKEASPCTTRRPRVAGSIHASWSNCASSLSLLKRKGSSEVEIIKALGVP